MGSEGPHDGCCGGEQERVVVQILTAQGAADLVMVHPPLDVLVGRDLPVRRWTGGREEADRLPQ